MTRLTCSCGAPLLVAVWWTFFRCAQCGRGWRAIEPGGPYERAAFARWRRAEL